MAALADGKDPIMNPFGAEEEEFRPTRAFFNRKKYGVISDEQLAMEKKFEEFLKKEGFASEDDYKEHYNMLEKEKKEFSEVEGKGALSKAMTYVKSRGRRSKVFVRRKIREVYHSFLGRDPREIRRFLEWWNKLPGPEVDLMEEQKRLLLMFCREHKTCPASWKDTEEKAVQPPSVVPSSGTQQRIQPPPVVPSSGP